MKTSYAYKGARAQNSGIHTSKKLFQLFGFRKMQYNIVTQ